MTTSGAPFSPDSTRRMRIPEGRWRNRVRSSGLCAGNIESGSRRSERVTDISDSNPLTSELSAFLDDFYLSTDEFSDESDAERYVRERSRSSSHRSPGEILEREHRPH